MLQVSRASRQPCVSDTESEVTRSCYELYGSVSGYLFGFLLNLSFWPFSLDPNSSIAYVPGLPFTEQWHRYLAFDLATSLGWDTGRAVTNFVCICWPAPLS